MGGTRTALYALLVLVLAVLVELGLHASDDAPSQDASVVFCTAAPARLDGLVNAAVSLGLAEPGSVPAAIRVRGGRVLPYARWRSEEGPDFRRACDAYAESAMPGGEGQGGQGSGLQAVLDTLLPVVAGALLTLAGNDLGQAAGRRWEMADELRAAWREFEEAVSSFLAACADAPDQGLPPLGEVNGRRRALQAVLRKAGARYRRSPPLRNLVDSMAAGVLGPSSLKPGWDPETGAGPVRERLSGCREAVEELAARLERGIWLRPHRRRGRA